MSETALQRQYAVILDTLSIATRQHWAWPSPEAAFSDYFLGTVNQQSATIAEPPAHSDEPLIHAPALACLGYEMARKRSLARRDQWLTGLGRLKARNAFPADRQSFVHRPLEVLGIALGIQACGLQAAESGVWLKGILTRTRRESLSVWFACLQYAAELVLDATGGRLPPLDDARNLLDLCAIRWLTQLTEASLSQEIETMILETAATVEWEPVDTAQAVVVYHMLRAAISRSIHAEVERNWVFGRENRTAETLILQIFRRFHRVAQQLLQRHGKRTSLQIGDEYDVQDLMHALLIMFFDDVRPETSTPNYAGNSSRTDFVIWNERIVVETKMTRQKLTQKEVANELILDKERYAADSRCDTLICFVYDPSGLCENPNALETDLAQDERPRTRVVVYSSRL